MDLSSLLHRPEVLTTSVFFPRVVAWLEVVWDAQRTGQLLDPFTPAHEGRDWSFYDEPNYPSVPSSAAASSSSSFLPDHDTWAAPRERLLSPVTISTNTIPSPISYNSSRDQDKWNYFPTPSPLTSIPYRCPIASLSVPLPMDNLGFITAPCPASHRPDFRTYPHPFPHIPPPQWQELQLGTDKLHHALRQQQVVAARHQWAAANPSLSSAYERSHRTAAAHATERRRRSLQTTPYYKMTLPYLTI